MITRTLKQFIACLTLLILSNTSFSQTQVVGEITGQVIDNSTKQTIPGVQVVIKGTTKVAITDSIGVFSLQTVEEGTYILEVNYYGYEKKEITEVKVYRKKATYIEIAITEARISLTEVEVKAFKYENNPTVPVSSYSFSREEIARNPGAQGDVFRAIGMIPGVSSSGGEYSAISVRGQGTRENAYFVDDIPLTDLGHLDGKGGFSDPNGARFSIFAPRVIDNAQFQGGGFGSQYGRKSASYLGLNIKEGNPLNPTIDGQIDLMGATINYDGPSYLHKKTSLFVSARFQDFKTVLNLIGLQSTGYASYQDFIFKSTTQLNPKNKLSIIMLYNPEKFSRDTSNVRYDIELNNLFVANVSKTKSMIGVNLRSLTSSRSYWKNIAYYTQSQSKDAYGTAYPLTDATGVLLPGSTISFENGIRKLNYSESKVGFRSIYTLKLKNNSTLIAGIDLDLSAIHSNRTLSRTDTVFVFNEFDYRPDPTQNFAIVSPQFFNASYSNTAFNMASYVSYSFQLFKQLTLNAGARYDYNGFTEQHLISPRLSGSWQMNATNSLNFAAGVYYQDPAYVAIADQPKDKKLKNEQTLQLILGYKKHFTADLKLTIEAWYKQFDQLIIRPINGYSEQNNSGDGWASGIDLNLTKRLTNKIYGQVGYSYMESKRNNHDGIGVYNFAFSQPHQVNFLLSYKPNEHWILATKFRYATGKPTDSFLVHADIFNDLSNLNYSFETVGRNAERLPDFISLDIRVDYRFQVKRVGITVFLDIVDVTNRQNANGQNFNAITGKTFYEGISIFPTFGLKFEF